MKTTIICLFILFQTPAFSQVPQLWEPRGVGGGGGLFSPSINPSEPNEYFVACDMSQLFHTGDFGLSYQQVDFRELEATPASKVWFTNQEGLLYCISNRTGVQLIAKSTDGGNTWQNVPGLQAWEWVYNLYVDYHNPQILVSNFWEAILISLDGGETFTVIHENDIGPGAHLAGVFFDYPDIYIGLNEGLLVSHNGGLSFAFEHIPGMTPGQGFYSFTGARQNDTVRLMGTTLDMNEFWNSMPASECWETVEDVYRIDYGLSDWISTGSTINWGIDYPMLIAMAENDIHTAYIGGGDAGSFPIILKTTNGGDTWQHVFLTFNNQNIYTAWMGYLGDKNWWYPGVALGIEVSRFNKNIVIFTDLMSVHKTSDGGETWFQAYTNPVCQNPPGSPSPKKQDYLSIGFENTSAWCMVWEDEQNIFAGFSDISGIRSKNDGLHWGFDYTGHSQNTMYWLEKHPDDGNLYAATSTVHDIYQTTGLTDTQIEYPGSGGKVIFSENGGENWHTLHDFGMPVYYLAIDRGNTEVMYASVINHSAGLGGIWKTENLSEGAGSTWQKLDNPPRTEGRPASIIVLNDGKVLTSWSARRNSSGAFTASSGVFLYDPNDANWQDLSHPNMHYWTKDIVVDPNDPGQNTWYACVWSGWGGPPNNKGGLYRTHNRGQSWEWIWDTHRVESCAFNPLNPDQLFATTEWQGLWVSNNINDAAPLFEEVENYNFMHPFRVFFNPYNHHEIWVTSFGNGLKTGSLLPYPQHLELKNLVLQADTDTCFAASQSISVTDVTFQPGSVVLLEAGEKIHFYPFIQVGYGANLQARIVDHQDFCLLNNSNLLSSQPEILSRQEESLLSNPTTRIYPNPTKGIFTIEFDGCNKHTNILVEMFNLHGESILRTAFANSGHLKLNLSDHPSGIYFIRIMNHDMPRVLKVIKQ